MNVISKAPEKLPSSHAVARISELIINPCYVLKDNNSEFNILSIFKDVQQEMAICIDFAYFIYSIIEWSLLYEIVICSRCN